MMSLGHLANIDSNNTALYFFFPDLLAFILHRCAGTLTKDS